MSELFGPKLEPANGNPANKLVILLHGYGSDGKDLIGLGDFWAQGFPDVEFLAPNAPEPCSVNPFGFEWFHLDLERGDTNYEAGAEQAYPLIRDYVLQRTADAGLKLSDVVLGGFSQGAMMALYAGLRFEEPLAGILAFSGKLVDADGIGDELESTPPVCLIHGEDDDVVPVQGSLEAQEALEQFYVNVSLKVSQKTGHSIAMDGLEFATGFLTHVLKPGQSVEDA
ncbi:alpha/beta hydrolase [Maritalea sp.]|uniref:alpha/beta hydrolase n=1 Tax=Maritalea sp. TaxID=2003361 RepID=UPI003EF1D445